jgi:hypothetical protein
MKFLNDFPIQDRPDLSIQDPPRRLAQAPTKQDVNILNAIPPSQIHPEQKYQMGEAAVPAKYREFIGLA